MGRRSGRGQMDCGELISTGMSLPSKVWVRAGDISIRGGMKQATEMFNVRSCAMMCQVFVAKKRGRRLRVGQRIDVGHRR